MLQAKFHPLQLEFTKMRQTSKLSLSSKTSWIIEVWDDINPNIIGVGECSYIEGISPESKQEYPKIIEKICSDIKNYEEHLYSTLTDYPSIKFGLETAIIDYKMGGKKYLFESNFTDKIKNIPINGLVWMGGFDDMKKQVDEKLSENFNCIKIKIGAIDFEEELKLIAYTRSKSKKLIIRLDANGSFNANDALDKLKALSAYNIHSIEQPIKAGQRDILQNIIDESPIPIALDEELIGLNTYEQKKQLMDEVHPHYLVLKPSLVGGFSGSAEWINLANEYGVDWWMTSYLESNIGLNAIAQWLGCFTNNLHQGLGTGNIYKNNLSAPIQLIGEQMQYTS